MSKPTVHIRISYKGWILQRLARWIAKRLQYVSYGLDPNRSAPIRYYMS